MNLLFKKTLKLSLICLLSIAWMVSCTEKVEYDDHDIPESNAIRVLIANEGQFGAGTASLTAIAYDNTVKNDVFRSVNKRPLGDVAQSITEIGDNFYVTLNNSRKVEVFNKETFKSVETIPTLDATIPTYIADLGNNEIAISEKGSGRLMLVNIDNMGSSVAKREIRAVPSVGSANQMKVIDNKLFLAGSTLRVFDTNNIQTESMREILEMIIDTTYKESAPTIIERFDTTYNQISVVGDSKIIADKNSKLWVLNSKKLACIDPKTEKVVKVFPFVGISIDGWGGRLDISPDGERLYFTGTVNNVGGVLTMSITDTEAPKELLFAHTGVRTLYGMSVSLEETIFIADVQFGSLARGLIHEYSTKGELLNTSEAGIFPSYFHFMKK